MCCDVADKRKHVESPDQDGCFTITESLRNPITTDVDAVSHREHVAKNGPSTERGRGIGHGIGHGDGRNEGYRQILQAQCELIRSRRDMVRRYEGDWGVAQWTHEIVGAILLDVPVVFYLIVVEDGMPADSDEEDFQRRVCMEHAS